MMRFEQPNYSAEKLCHCRLLCDLEDSLKEFDQNDLGGRAVKGCALGWGERPSLPSAGPATSTLLAVLQCYSATVLLAVS